MSHVIAAVSTGHAVCAIGIIRLSGDGAIQLADRFFSAVSGIKLTDTPDRRMVLGSLLDEKGRILDQILAVVARAPHSYTGEDTVEFQCHGSPAVLSAGLAALFSAGARQAGPGEFTKRAFLNGCMDLSQAEAVIDLIEAETAEAAANASGQLSGAISRQIGPVYDSLAGICAHFHAVLDYPDEDIAPFHLSDFRGKINAALGTLAQLRSTYDRGRVLKNGIQAAIVGKPNAGKSSLLNALAGYDRVIVTEQAGTTRDAVTEVLHLGGVVLRLTDTAGIRDAEDPIEARGIQKALEAAAHADLLLCVFDGSQPLDDADQMVMDAAENAPHAVAILNKQDLPAVLTPSDMLFDMVVCVSAKTGEGLDCLEDAVEALYPEDAPMDGTILTNARQAAALDRAGEALARTLTVIGKLTPDAVLTDVEEALEALGEITGKTMRQEITDQIFSRFCVGK